MAMECQSATREDPLDAAQAARDEAINDFSYTAERLSSHVLQLRDPRLRDLVLDLLDRSAALVEKEQAVCKAFIDSISRIHEAELRMLGTTSKEAAGRLLAETPRLSVAGL